MYFYKPLDFSYCNEFDEFGSFGTNKYELNIQIHLCHIKKCALKPGLENKKVYVFRLYKANTIILSLLVLSTGLSFQV